MNRFLTGSPIDSSAQRSIASSLLASRAMVLISVTDELLSMFDSAWSVAVLTEGGVSRRACADSSRKAATAIYGQGWGGLDRIAEWIATLGIAAAVGEGAGGDIALMLCGLASPEGFTPDDLFSRKYAKMRKDATRGQ